MTKSTRSTRRRILWLVCTAALALAAAALRLFQRATAFEEPLGLAIPHAPASVILICVLVIACAVLAMLAAAQPVRTRAPARGQARRWDLTFWDQNDKVYPVLLIAAAFLALAAAPILFARGFRQMQMYLTMQGLHDRPTDNGLLMLITAAGALLAFIGLALAGRESLRPAKRGGGSFSIALPALTGCVWLMESFRSHASDPVLWDYAPQLLAIIAGMLFYLDCAGMSGSAAHPRRLLWLAGITVVLSALSAVGQSSPGDLLLLASQALAALAALWRLPPNLEHPPAPARPGPVKQVPPQEEGSTHE